jgi:hypothetical protein
MLESMAAPFVISPSERRELMKMANSRIVRSEDGRRARIILDLGRGLSLRAISAGERPAGVDRYSPDISVLTPDLLEGLPKTEIRL